MIAGVEAVAAERGEVDPPDEGDLVIDDHELLVVAVHRTLVGVERAAYRCAPGELGVDLTDGGARGSEDRGGRARPEQHAYVDPLGELGEQVA